MSDSRAAEGSSHNPTSAASPTPAELFQAGLQHLSAGRALDAQICCRRALEIEAGFTDALHLLRLIAMQAQDETRDFTSVVARVRTELVALISAA